MPDLAPVDEERLEEGGEYHTVVENVFLDRHGNRVRSTSCVELSVPCYR